MAENVTSKFVEQSKLDVAKFRLNPEEVKKETIPDPITLGGVEEIGLHRIEPIEIPRFLYMHPALPRGIEIKANRMIRLGFDINPFDDSSQSKEAVDYCLGILNNSDRKPKIFLKKYIQDTYRFGSGRFVLISNKMENEILKFELQHPIFFGPAKYPKDSTAVIVIEEKPLEGGISVKTEIKLAGKLKIDNVTKKPSHFTQFQKRFQRELTNFHVGGAALPAIRNLAEKTANELRGRKKFELVPIGTEILAKQVVQMEFDVIGDEPVGIPLVQFVHLTINHLLDMERAGAQTIVNFGFNKYKAKTPFKSIEKMNEFAQTLANIHKRSVIVLPDGTDINNLIPGSTEFKAYHDVFLTLIATRLGIPKPILLQDGTSTNKATLEKMMTDMVNDFFADEMVVEGAMDEAFEKACIVKFGEKFNKFPKFKFKERPEDMDKKVDRDVRQSIVIRNTTRSLEILKDQGFDEEAKRLVQDMMSRLGIEKEENGKKD